MKASGSVVPPVNAGEHVSPSFRVGRELDFHGVAVVVDDFVDVARVAAQRAAHQDQGLAGPAARGRRRRVVAERIVPEQFVVPVFAVVGEHAVGGEAFLAVAHLNRVLDQVEPVEIDSRLDQRRGGPARVPARRIDHLFAGPFARENRELAMLVKSCRRGEMVGHRQPPFTAFTIFCAASSRSSAGSTLRPDSRMIFLPASTLVPSSRTTSGTFRPTSFTAATTPSAMMSHFMMPPKMLTRMPFTLGSAVMILKAAATFFLLAPPPPPRKLAGSMPYSLMMSMVAMARP